MRRCVLKAPINRFLVWAFVFAPASAAIAGPPPMPCCPTTTQLFSNSSGVAIPDNGSISRSFTVIGAGAYLWDVALTTFVTHPVSSQVTMQLTSPAGTVVTLTSNNGGARADIYNGVLWTDQAGSYVPPGAVTDAFLTSGVAPAALCPEEAMGAFRGENPNGVWQLTMLDNAGGSTGAFVASSLRLTTCPAPPVVVTAVESNNVLRPINDLSTVVSTVVVTGLGPTTTRVELRTFISHTFPADLVVTLISPKGTAVTITSRNGGSADNVFNGTIWRDDAGAANPPGPVTDQTFASHIVETPICPEEAMGAFSGEDPNGVWTLQVEDLGIDDIGALNSWSLTVGACGDPTCDADLNGDGVVNASDLALLLTRWGSCL